MIFVTYATKRQKIADWAMFEGKVAGSALILKISHFEGELLAFLDMLAELHESYVHHVGSLKTEEEQSLNKANR